MEDRQLLDTLIDIDAVYIVGLDRDARIRFMNPPMRRALGLGSMAEVQGQDYLLLAAEPHERETMRAVLERAFASDEAGPSSVSVREIRGKLIEWYPRRVANEDVALFLGVDITRRQEAEERARERERQLAESARLASIGTLVSAFTHELNSPNGYLRMNAESLAACWGDVERVLEAADGSHPGMSIGGLPLAGARETLRRLVEGILKGSTRISQLAAELRAWVRNERTQLAGTADVNAAIACSLGALKDVTSASTDHLSVTCEEGLPRVAGNRKLIEVLVDNLVRNACQALTDRSQGISIVSRGGGPGWVEILVADEGMGIREENVGRVFDPFFTTRRESGGMGLGLTIVSGIVRTAGGHITCRSVPGAGTEFLVRLPAPGAGE